MCGDQEVLRDEIIYVSRTPARRSRCEFPTDRFLSFPFSKQMAHRAANPKKYPVRQHLLDANPERTKKHAEYPPTKVRFSFARSPISSRRGH